MSLLSASIKSFFSGSGGNVFFFKVKVTHCWRCRFGICDISAFVYNQNYALFKHFSQRILNDVISSKPTLCQFGDLDPYN